MTINIGLPTDGVPDQGWKLYITSLVSILVAGLFVIARCATRALSYKLGADDYTIVVSLVWHCLEIPDKGSSTDCIVS